jgi:hypothetical protein
MRQNLFLFLIFFYFHTVFCQSTQVIRVKKTDNNLYFFQKGNSSDTISKNKGDLFYLLPKDKLKKILIIHIENGQLLKTHNDSIFKLNYVKGIGYEGVFERIFDLNEKPAKGPESKQALKFEFKCLINGVSSEKQNKVVFRFKVKGEANPFLENTFYFQE